MSSDHRLVAISVGNTRTAFACFIGSAIGAVRRIPNEQSALLTDEIVGAFTSLDEPDQPRPRILLASVNDAVADSLHRRIEDRTEVEVLRLEADVEVAIGRCLDADARPGVDRLLNAAAAFDKLKQACVIVDAGTAITVDFVDGEGTFHGGAILPGFGMQLRSLHEGTALLPAIEPARPPSDDPFGHNTRDAILNGVYYGIRGAVRHLTERYAEHYSGYPMLIATGGDAHLLFDDEELFDRIVDDLTLWGVEVSWRRHFADADDPAPAE